MALTLYLLRHAKAVVAGGSIADFDRPLAARGQREAGALAAYMAERGHAPVRILCSSSQRTRETLAPLLAAWPANAAVEISRQLYNADADDLLSLVCATEEAATSLMLIGHNPGIEQLARALAGDGDDAAMRRMRDHYPPAGLAVSDFDASAWSDIRPGAGHLSAIETPRG
jgi:phosphohistidine phosphatase